MTVKTRIVCQECRFWEYLGEGETSLGQCHRHAPRPEAEDVMGDVPTHWPDTDARDWCGEAVASDPVFGAVEQREESRHLKSAELQEIADGAWGDGPYVRGKARDLLANRLSETEADKKTSDGEHNG